MQQTSIETIEEALKYVGSLPEASREAQRHLDKENGPHECPATRSKHQALQAVKYELAAPDFHALKCRRILGDLRRLRRFI
jgi:hypothetical protein